MKSCIITIPQNPPVNWRGGGLSTKPETFQLELFPLPPKRQKAQISSVPGISIRKRDRYQVMAGARIIATHLDIDDALEIAANCTGVAGVDA